jgi:hypothetical protein
MVSSGGQAQGEPSFCAQKVRSYGSFLVKSEFLYRPRIIPGTACWFVVTCCSTPRSSPSTTFPTASYFLTPWMEAASVPISSALTFLTTQVARWDVREVRMRVTLISLVVALAANGGYRRIAPLQEMQSPHRKPTQRTTLDERVWW